MNREENPKLGRREMLAYTAAFGGAFLAANGMAHAEDTGDKASGGGTKPARKPKFRAPKRYAMKKSINLWAFPYPEPMSLRECLELAKDAGFDGVELNFNLEGEFSAESSADEIVAIREMAEKIGIQISGVCSFLFWPYAMTHNDPERREKGVQIWRCR